MKESITAPRPAKARAPLRLDFAGGWTDVAPFSTREGGLVVNAAIGLFAHAEVEPHPDGLVVTSHDLGEELRVNGIDQLCPEGRLSLLQAAVRLFPVFPARISTRSDAPAGSGLGSSGALDVALVSALSRARGDLLESETLAESAWRLEVMEAGMPGGKQDQYAAALGGFRTLTFKDPSVETARLHLDPAFLAHLERHIVLCYTGTSRISGRMIERVIRGYEKGDETVVRAFREIKEAAAEMAAALSAGDATRVGSLLSQNWACQRALDEGMQTDEMRRLEAAARDAGVLGGKAAGAGAGGCMFFLAASDPGKVARAAREAGARVLPLTWASDGAKAW